MLGFGLLVNDQKSYSTLEGVVDGDESQAAQMLGRLHLALGQLNPN